MFSQTIFCNRCGKRFANKASVLNHQKQLSSACWKTYSRLLELQQPIDALSHTSPTSAPSPSISSQFAPSLLEADSDMDFPEPTHFSPMDADMVIDNVGDRQSPKQEATLPLYHTEFFLGASKVFGKGETYLDHFNKDKHEDARKKNLFYPFASQPEWELASFLLKSDLSRVAIDQFLKLQLVCVTFQSMDL